MQNSGVKSTSRCGDSTADSLINCDEAAARCIGDRYRMSFLANASPVDPLRGDSERLVRSTGDLDIERLPFDQLRSSDCKEERCICDISFLLALASKCGDIRADLSALCTDTTLTRFKSERCVTLFFGEDFGVTVLRGDAERFGVIFSDITPLRGDIERLGERTADSGISFVDEC